MFTYYRQNAGQITTWRWLINHSKIWQTNQNCRHEYTENRLTSWNAWYSSVKNLFFSSLLLFRNLKIKTKGELQPCVLFCKEVISASHVMGKTLSEGFWNCLFPCILTHLIYIFFMKQTNKCTHKTNLIVHESSTVFRCCSTILKSRHTQWPLYAALSSSNWIYASRTSYNVHSTRPFIPERSMLSQTYDRGLCKQLNVSR